MHVITLPNGLRVDLGAATVSLSSRWTSDDRAKEGLAADIVCASIDAPVITGNGFATVETICDTAGGAARRARVVAELIEKAVTRRATYDAAELGDTVVATNVQCVFEAYVADNKLSEKRAAGVRAKCAALGYVW